jgi:ABC-type sugar transport systems, permease components
LSNGSVTAEPPVTAAPRASAGSAGLARYRTGALFLLPAFFLLFVWIVYPAIYTIVRSFFGQQGYIGTWVGIDNYKRLFTTHTLITAIKNNVIWVLVVPAFVTAFGLVFALLTEKIRWSLAFKTVIFLPMAISAFATGVTWRIMYQQDPSVGAVNALGKAAKDFVTPPGVLSSAAPSTGNVVPNRWRARAEDAAAPRRCRADRPDRDPAHRRAERRQAGRHGAGEDRARSPAPSGATSSPAAASPASSSRASWGSRA